MKYKLFISVGLLGILTTGSLFAVTAYAQDDLPVLEEVISTHPSIVTKLAERFGVSEEEVQAVFDEDREARQDERLDRLVTDGTLTQEQREAFEVMQDEFHKNLEDIRNNSKLNGEEKRKAEKELRNEMKELLEEKGIEIPGELSIKHQKRFGFGSVM